VLSLALLAPAGPGAEGPGCGQALVINSEIALSADELEWRRAMLAMTAGESISDLVSIGFVHVTTLCLIVAEEGDPRLHRHSLLMIRRRAV
jgi:hypothetical protein